MANIPRYYTKRKLQFSELPFKHRILVGKYHCVLCNNVHEIECCTDASINGSYYMHIHKAGNEWLRLAKESTLCPFKTGKQQFNLAIPHIVAVVRKPLPRHSKRAGFCTHHIP